MDHNTPNRQQKYILHLLDRGEFGKVIAGIQFDDREVVLDVLQNYIPNVSNQTLAFEIGPALAGALEDGYLKSTDIDPRIWIRIENILDSLEEELEIPKAQTTDVIPPPNANVLQFPLKAPEAIVEIERPYPLAHFIFEEGKFPSATVYVQGDKFLLKTFSNFVARPLPFDQDMMDVTPIEDPKQLADLLLEAGLKSMSFLKLCRQDGAFSEDGFYLYETFKPGSKKEILEEIVPDKNFEDGNYHFRHDAIPHISNGDGAAQLTDQGQWQGFRRLNDLWSPPYLGEIIFKELQKEIHKLRELVKEAV